MVITSLQEKQNRKFYVPIRPGNRGGWSLFEWQSVRDMPYRDREMYLGNSAVIGVLDRGGRWRKRDWYLKTDKNYNDPNLEQKKKQTMQRDMQRMKAQLGGYEMQDEQRITEEEMAEIMKKIRNKGQEGEDEGVKGGVGLGFDKTRVQIRAKPGVNGANANKLEGFDEIGDVKEKTEKQEKKRKHRERSIDEQDEDKRQKKNKKEKKDKERKKEKKNRDRSRSKDHSEQKQRRRERSRSRSKDKKHKKQKHRKHREKSRSPN